jgi:hypothetical protein
VQRLITGGFYYMEQNALADVMAQLKQQKLEQSLDALTQELVKVNARLEEIESLLKTSSNSDKTYIG